MPRKMHKSTDWERDWGHMGEEDGLFQFITRRDEGAIICDLHSPLCYNIEVHPEFTMPNNDEYDLIAAAQDGDRKAVEALLLKYERLCHKLARKFAFTAPSFQHEDLVQEGRIALIEAINTYETGRGAVFLTWAYYHVRGRIASAGKSDRKQPRYPRSIEDCPRAYNVEDPTQAIEVKDDLPRGLALKLIEECCGGLHTKRAKIVIDRYGLLGKPELRNCECVEKYGITKYAVNSHCFQFKKKVRARFPELANFV